MMCACSVDGESGLNKSWNSSNFRLSSVVTAFTNPNNWFEAFSLTRHSAATKTTAEGSPRKQLFQRIVLHSRLTAADGLGRFAPASRRQQDGRE